MERDTRNALPPPAAGRARALIAATMLALLASCATAPEREAEQQEQEAAKPFDPSGSVQHSVDNRAVALLWDKAEKARRSDRLDEAAGTLERALRLAPEDPVIWSRLAEVRLRQKQFAVAENLAAKSNALAGERPLLRYRNWLLIAEARRRRGDDAGAKEARANADEIRSSD